MNQEMIVEVTTCPNMATFIDWLFDRLHTTYGASWKRQFDGLPESSVKSQWGYELAWAFGRKEVIRFALENLPERPPNGIEFRNLCRKAPAPTVVLLPEPKADPARVRAALQTIPPAPVVGRLDWARALQRRDEDNPKSVTPTIRKMYRDALGLNRVIPVAQVEPENN